MTEVRDHYRVPYPDNYGSNTYPKPALPVVYDNLQVHERPLEKGSYYSS